MTDSFEVMRNYLSREMNSSEFDKASIEARKIVAKVQSAKGNDLKEKAKNAGISYDDYMKAQRLATKRVS